MEYGDRGQGDSASRADSDGIGRILVVDDSRAMLSVISAMLQDLQIAADQIGTASSGEQALAQIDAAPERYQLLFVDLHMPGLDGMELIRRLGQSGFRGGIVILSAMEPRIIDLAAELAVENRARLIAAISKPPDAGKLGIALQKARFFQHKIRAKPQLMAVDALQEAIYAQQVMPYYQPKIEAGSHRLHSLEVLARIRVPGQVDSLTPEAFILRAEEHHLLNLISFQLLGKALHDYAALKACFGHSFQLCLNIAPCQLDDFGFPARLESFLGSREVDPSRIVLEITENNALRTPAQLENLNRLRMHGFGISLDDYGVGFTNVKQLRTLPFSEIKIDRTLITAIHSDGFSQAIVASLAEITRRFGVQLVAEGLESWEELNYLQEHYPQMLLQGYLITRPKSCAALQQWYQSWKTVFSASD